MAGEGPLKWSGRLEEAFEAEVARQGGVHSARPKAVLEALQPLFPELGLQAQNVKWHLQAHRKREEKAREWLATSEGPVRWTGRLKQAFKQAVKDQGGLQAARPKLLWTALQAEYPMLTIQNCKWHLQTLRKKELPGPDSEGEGAEATAAERTVSLPSPEESEPADFDEQDPGCQADASPSKQQRPHQQEKQQQQQQQQQEAAQEAQQTPCMGEGEAQQQGPSQSLAQQRAVSAVLAHDLQRGQPSRQAKSRLQPQDVQAPPPQQHEPRQQAGQQADSRRNKADGTVCANSLSQSESLATAGSMAALLGLVEQQGQAGEARAQPWHCAGPKPGRVPEAWEGPLVVAAHDGLARARHIVRLVTRLVEELRMRAAVQAELLQQLEGQGPASAELLAGTQRLALPGLAPGAAGGGPGQGPGAAQPASSAAALLGAQQQRGVATLGALAPLLAAGLVSEAAAAYADDMQGVEGGGWHDTASCTVEGCRMCAYLARLARAEAAEQRGEPLPAVAGGQRRVAAVTTPPKRKWQPVQQPQRQQQQDWQAMHQPQLRTASQPAPVQPKQLQQPVSDETGEQALPLLALQGLLSSFLPPSSAAPPFVPGGAVQHRAACSAAGGPGLPTLPASSSPEFAIAAQLLAEMHPNLSPDVCTAICRAVPSEPAGQAAMARWLLQAGAVTPAQVAGMLASSPAFLRLASDATEGQGLQLVHWAALLVACRQLP